MKNLTQLIPILLLTLAFVACTDSVQEEGAKTASYETVSKTVTEQSPAYIRAAPPTPVSHLKMQMDGTWQDTNEPKRMFVISGDEYYELYEGRQVSKMKFDIYNACPADKGEIDESGSYIWLRSSVDTTCFEISNLDNTVMVLIDGEEGKQVRYERK